MVSGGRAFKSSEDFERYVGGLADVLGAAVGSSRALVDAYLTKSDLPLDPLTLREREVLQLVAEGKSTKEIAAVLGLSVKTAETHRGRIMRKLDIRETAGLVRYAIRRGLVRP